MTYHVQAGAASSSLRFSFSFSLSSSSLPTCCQTILAPWTTEPAQPPYLYCRGIYRPNHVECHFLGPVLDSCCARYSALVVTVAHLLGMIGFFEFCVSLLITFVSGYGSLRLTDAVLGLITIVAMQHAIHKVLISVFHEMGGSL